MKKSHQIVFLACVVGGSALWILATRPCEPKAHASTEPQVISVPEATFVAIMPQAPVVDLPKVVASKPHHLASTPKKDGGECTAKTPGVKLSYEESNGTPGQMVAFYDCRH